MDNKFLCFSKVQCERKITFDNLEFESLRN